jgi:hexosaminidase
LHDADSSCGAAVVLFSSHRQIDGLLYNKMNTLHWHLTDAQSTPYDSAVHPLLKQGAFSPKAVYTADDIKGVVEYARQRGVQILMEVDMPGYVLFVCCCCVVY